jgi:hypothetical protein
VDGVKLALIGSPTSLIGAAADAAAEHNLDAYTIQFLRRTAESAPGERLPRGPGGTGEAESYEAAIDETLELGVLPPGRHQLEFLAKVLFHNDRVLVATPIYVALAD